MRFDVPVGTERTTDVPLFGPLAAGPTPLKIRVTGEDQPEVTVAVVPGGRALRVRARGRATGTVVGKIFVYPSQQVPERFVLPYAVRVTGALEVSPDRLVFKLGAPGPQRQFISVRGTRVGFAVAGVTISEGPFLAALEKSAQGNERRVRVELRPHVGDEQVTGHLVIRSNDPSEPSKEIPLLAVGKRPLGTAEAPEDD